MQSRQRTGWRCPGRAHSSAEPAASAALCQAPRGKTPGGSGRSWANAPPRAGAAGSVQAPQLGTGTPGTPLRPVTGCSSPYTSCFHEMALRVVLRQATPLPAAVTFCLQFRSLPRLLANSYSTFKTHISSTGEHAVLTHNSPRELRTLDGRGLGQFGCHPLCL